jgi:CHAT domain-containing protein
MASRALRDSLAALLALCLLFSATVAESKFQSGDEPQIRALVERYFAAYAKKDLDAISQLWSDKSPDLGQTKTRLKEFYSIYNQIETQNWRFRQLKIQVDHATALVTLEVAAVEAKTNKPALGLGKRSQNISFVKEAGEWRIWQDALAEEELARRLVAATRNEERESLLAEDNELLTPALGRSIYRIGERFRMQLDFEQAMKAYDLMKIIAERIGDKYMLAVSDNVTGVVLVLLGDYEGGLKSLNESIRLRQELGRRDLLSIPLGISASAYGQQGNYSKALETAYTALAIVNEAGDASRVADLNYEIGLLNRMQYNLDLALEYLKKALSASEETGNTALAAQTLESISLTYSMGGDYNAALDAAQKALKVMGNPTSGISAATMFMSIGNTHQTFGKYSLALEYHLKALPEIEKVGVKYTLANLLTTIGTDYYFLGDYEKAVEYSVRASGVARQSNLLDLLSQSLPYAGLAYRALGRLDEARRSFEEAIGLNETLRGRVWGGEQEQQRFFEQKTLPYYAMVELLVAEKKYDAALSYAEQAKGRVLLDVIRSGRAGIAKTMSPEETEQEKKLSQSVASFNTKIQGESARPQPNQERLAGFKTSLEEARLAEKTFHAKLYTAHPELRVRRGESQALTLDQAGELLTDSSSALLEYAVAADHTFLFVLTSSLQKPVLKVYDLKFKRKELVDRVQKLNQRIANNDVEYAALASELYDSLIAPAREQLQGKTRLVIVPDDILWETPFQALRSTDGRFLVQSAAISYAPSLTVLREIVKSRRPRSATTLLAMGNPKLAGQTISRSKYTLMSAGFEPLPEAERMVIGLSQMYGAKARVYVGAEAREDLFKAEAGDYRILQLATHGVINNASPMYSHLVLAQGNDAKEDGLLEAWEIMQLDLKADLAVLSACDTARGRIGAGEGVIGLAWALFVAGCPTTVVSQWKVESASTAELMLAFHRNLQSGSSKSEGLRQASMKLMADKKYNHPFYWAGFIVVGDPQ